MSRAFRGTAIHQTGFAAVCLLTSLLTGCSGFHAIAPAPAAIAGPSFQGSVFGGQQPIGGASLALYAAGSSGYGSASINLLTAPVATTAAGNFTIANFYTCTPGQQLYIVATGGNPGGGINANVGLMAALGDCTSLSSTKFIDINEVTTIGSVFALAPFMTGLANVGSSSTNGAGLVHAFASVNKLVNTSTGTAVGPALPAKAIGPTSEILTLANIIAACINSTGGVAGDTSACGTLFKLATPTGGMAPADTIQATLNIAHNPTLNVTALYDSAPPASPFGPQLSAAPTDWTLAVTYLTGGFQVPTTTAVDASGNIWVANRAGDSVTVLTQAGAPVANSPFRGNGLAAPAAVAIDAQGNGWIANSGLRSVSVFTASGNAISGSPFDGGGMIDAPSSIAIDAPGNVWLGNTLNNSITELSSSGGFLQQVSGGVKSPTALAINPK